MVTTEGARGIAVLVRASPVTRQRHRGSARGAGEATLSKSSRASQIRVYVRGHKETCPRRHAGQDRMSDQSDEREMAGNRDYREGRWGQKA